MSSFDSWRPEVERQAQAGNPELLDLTEKALATERQVSALSAQEFQELMKLLQQGRQVQQ